MVSHNMRATRGRTDNSGQPSGGSGCLAETVLKTAGPGPGAAASPPSTTAGVEGEVRDDSGEESSDGNDFADETVVHSGPGGRGGRESTSPAPPQGRIWGVRSLWRDPRKEARGYYERDPDPYWRESFYPSVFLGAVRSRPISPASSLGRDSWGEPIEWVPLGPGPDWEERYRSECLAQAEHEERWRASAASPARRPPWGI